ncbi:hypothetical protein [Rickettsia endosymbiont of Polydrusus tereticollis]|uniref:beta strand repeat-containing protein n=1 Tax=Rickettsia endosymbiont of Polydrusus tereticollis TaxID=3066251 RepID=UPI0031331E19
MTGNSSKFFRKILKTGLVTASGAAIMLSSSGALGAAARTTANNGVNLATGVNLGEAAAVFTPGSTLQFTGVHTVTAMNINVGAVDMNNFAGGPATITKSIGLGSVVDNVAANKLNVSINNGVTLTLTGTGDGGLGFVGGGNAAANDYTALGNITLGGATAGLTINSATPALITLTGTIDGAGNLLVSTPTDFTAAIGATTPLGAVTFNNGNGLNAATAKAITATTVTIGKDAANNASAVSTGKIGGAVNFTADGQLTVDGGITGAVTTAANDEGTLIVTAGNVADIGVGAPLKQVTFNGVSILNGVIDAKTITINGAVTANVGAITGNVNITSGTLTTNQVITGDLDVSGTGNLAGDAAATDVAGTVTLQAGATGAVTIHDALNAAVVMTEGGTLTLRKAAGGIKFTGTAIAGTIINVVDDVASNVGDVNNDAANGAGTGILNFLGAGTAGTIGANNSLAEVNFKGAGAVAITGTSNATTFTVGDAGADVTATGLMTGKVAFTADGQLTLGNGITGAVTTAANNTGKLIVTAGDVGGAIGTNGVNILNSVTFNGASNVTTIDATTVAIGAGGDVKTTGAVTADVNFTGDEQLTVGAGGITGAVTTAINDEGTLIVTAGDIQAVGGVGKSLKQVTFNGASTLNGAIDAQTITINGAVTAKVGAITGNVNITSGTLDTNQDITGNLNVSGGGNLAGVVGTTNITETVTLQATAGNVAINNAIGNVAVAGGTLNLAVAAGDMTITGGTVTQTDDIVGNLTVSGAGNLAGAVGATNVGGTVTLQPGATGIVTIKDALNAAAVSVAGGTLNIHNAAGGINFTGNADATVNVAAGGDVGAVNNTTKIDGIGILNFTDAGDAGAVGATNSLKEVRFSGAGVVTLGAVTATNINFANAAVVNANGNITANIDFKNNDGVIILDDGVNITGTVGSTLGVNGTLSFLGSSTVTETIGGAAGIAKLELIQAKGNGGNVVDFNKDVFVTDLKFTPVVIGPASTIKIGGNLTGNVTFYAGNNNGGILEFNGNAVDAAGDPIVYKFDGDIAANADKGTLNVNTTLLIATSATVTGLKEINIVNTKALAIDASNGDVTLPAVQTIAFAGANSGLGFSNTGNRDNAKIIFSGDFVPANDGQGRITFASADPNDIGGAVPKALTIISDNPANIRKIGTAAVGGKKFANLSVFDQVIVDKTIDLSGIAELDVINGANFVDQGATSAAIQIINIGADGGAGTGPATHTIDVSTAAAVNLLGDNVKFADAGSTFKLQNTVAGNKTVTLANNIEGNVANGAGGIVELNADFAGGVSILTIDGGGGAGKSLGTAANKLQTLIFSGNGEIKLINKATFNAINLNLGVTAIELGDIVQHLEFSGDTTLTETGDIASVDFKGFNAVINMDPGKNITGTVTNTGVATTTEP